jgi:hypothetical protein
MKEIREVKKKISRNSFFIAGVLFFITLVMGKLYISGGILLGVCAGLFNFLLLARKIESQNLGYLFFLNYIFRYLILAGVLILAAFVDRRAFLGAAIGVLVPQFVIYWEKWELSKSLKS